MPQLTLSMIVKNEEKYLRDCLESVKNVVDDIVIVDTGSTDNTIEIAKEYNAKVFHFDWIKDFSAARNYALEKSEGEWILYLDADERIDKDSIEELKRIIITTTKAGYFCTVKSFDDENGRDNTIRYVRLFKNSNRIKFTGKVHEQIVPSLNENNYELFHCTIQINHIGYNVSKAEKENKANRNLELLLKDYNQTKTAYTAFQLGQTYSVLNNHSESEKYFNIVLNSKEISSDLKAESYAYLAHILHTKLDVLGAEKYLLSAIDINPKQAYYYLLLSKISLRKQDYVKAKLYCKKSYELNKSNSANQKYNAQTVFLNPREILYFALYLAYHTNDHDYTNYFITEFYKIIKNDNQMEKISLIKAMESILKGRELTEATGLEMMRFIDRNNIDLFQEAIMRQKNLQIKCKLLEKLKKSFDKNPSVIKNLSIIYDQDNKTKLAIELLENNRELIEKDAGALFYLASYYLKIGQIESSLKLFTHIEEHFPQIKEIQPKVKVIKEKLLALQNATN